MCLTRWLSVLLLAGAALPSAHAQAKPASPPAAAAPDFSKEAYVVEKSYQRIKAENDGTGTRELAVEVRMLADAGVKTFAVLNFTYTSANEVVDIDYVRVRKPDGTVVKTPDYNIQDMPGEVTRTAPLYSDIHEKHVAVKGLSVGDVLEYLVRFRVIKPEVPGQFWQEYSFLKDAIVRDEHYEISFPSGKFVKIVSPEFKPEVTEESGQKIVRWTHSNLIVKQKDPREIPRRIPPKPDVQITTFASWEEVGRWYGDLQKEPVQVTTAIQKKADELTQGLKTDDERIRATYNFVALKYHYIGLDFGIGRYQPHAADDVLDNGYGDCKDKHTLMASLLKAEGIEAWPALIHSTRKLDPDVPSPAQFNHVITVVPRGDRFVWLDTTPEIAPHELLMLALRGKQALVVPTSKPAVLMTTPQNAPFLQVQSMSMEGKLNAEGTFTGHSEQSYHGDTEVVLRSVFRQVPQSQWKEAVQRFSYGLNFGGDVSNVNMTQPDDLSKPFELSYDYERKKYGGWEDKQLTPPMPPMGLEMMKDAKKPPEPLVLGGLGEVMYDGKITLPPGYSGSGIPQNVDLVRPYAEYHSSYGLENGVFTAKRRLVIKKTEVELSSWEDFQNFAKGLSDDENRFVTLSGGTKINAGAGAGSGAKSSNEDLDALLQEAADALNKRDFTRTEELVRRVVAADPTRRGAHYNLAIALAAQGKMPDALAEIHKEVEVSPDDARTYQIAATFEEYAHHFDDAIRDWVNLLKVDPKNREAALKVSRLLMGGGKNAQALAVLEEAVKQSPGSPSLEMALGETYVANGDADQGVLHMREATKAAADPKGPDPGMLNDAAYMLVTHNTHLGDAKEFSEKALAELEQRSVEAAQKDDASGFPLTPRLMATWDTLGWIHYQMEDYGLAEDYLRPAWVLGQDGVAGDHLAQTLEKLGKKKEAEKVYVQALSAQYVPIPSWANPATDPSQTYATNRNLILSHYSKLTGRKEPPAIDIKRLPNGEWTKMPSDELLEKRRANVTKTSRLSGHCDFEMVFAPGKVASVRFLDGDPAVKEVAAKLQATHFDVVFPSASGARIFRKVTLTCSPTSGCNAEMLPARQAVEVTR